MLQWRLPLGAALILGLVALCWLDHRSSLPGAWLVPLALVFTLLASAEMLRLLAARQCDPEHWVVYIGNSLMVASSAVPLWWPEILPSLAWPALAFSFMVIAVFVVEMRRFAQPGNATIRAATAILALVYVGWFLSFVVQMRGLGNGTWGVSAIASLIIVVKMCDTGAYTVGRLIGRHKMTPVLSPGKTVEGAIGGLAFACLGAWLAIEWFLPRTLSAGAHAEPPANSRHWIWLVYGLAVGGAGILGDLAESLLKRDAGVKDSGDWLPGFGGVLDLLDSILLAVPVAYFFWISGLIQP